MTAMPITESRRSRGRPTTDEVAAIDSELLAVALKEFGRSGYGGTSMTGIIKAAGISKTTMYSRFGSKERLFRAIMEQQIERVASSMPLGSPDSYPNLIEGLKGFANRALEVSLQPDFIEINRLIYSESGRFPELGTAAAERNRVGIQQVTDFIRERADQDAVPCRDPERVAEMFILLTRGWYVSTLLISQPVSEDDRRRWVDRAVKTLVASRIHW